MILLVSGATRTAKPDHVGHLIVPGNWSAPTSLALVSRRWAMDNGAFSGLDVPGFLSMLAAYRGQAGCLFVTVPDVPFHAGKTLELWPVWSAVVRSFGFPPALALQNGLEPEQIPWPELGAVFVGGDDAFKESRRVASMTAYAKARGIWVHWGRVNTRRRMRLAIEAGADSFDGSGFSRWPDRRIPLAGRWLNDIATTPRMTALT